MEPLNNTSEQLSALADGQLKGDAFVQAVMAACADEAALKTWNTYHLIGDVLRAQDLAGRGSELAFAQAVQARLKDEPVPLVAEAANATHLIAARALPVSTGSMNIVNFNKPAANDAQMRWKLVAGVASFAAVAAIGWNLVVAGSGGGEAPTLAQTPATAPVLQAVGESGQYMMRDPRLDELLAAHRQAGGTSALQMPSGFLRSATFEPAGR